MNYSKYFYQRAYTSTVIIYAKPELMYCAGVQPLEAPNSFPELELSRLFQRVNQGSQHFVLKGIVQPFELGGVTSPIRSAVRFCKAGHFQKKIFMIQSHERSLKQNSAA
jgi:hypothetical protein